MLGDVQGKKEEEAGGGSNQDTLYTRMKLSKNERYFLKSHIQVCAKNIIIKK